MAQTRQRMFQQKGQVDTQYEIIGGRDFESKPSDEVVNEFDTTDSLIVDAQSQAPGHADNAAWEPSTASGAPVGMLYGQEDDVATQESYTIGPRYDSAVTEAFKSFANTNLSAQITSGATSLTVGSAQNFPASGNYTILIDQEQLLVTAGQGTTTWTVTRAQGGTTAAAHAADAVVRLV